jgi:hypothetical protein
MSWISIRQGGGSVEAVRRLLIRPRELGFLTGNDPITAFKDNAYFSKFVLNQDENFGKIFVPDDYVSGGKIRVCWTKTANTDQAGKRVKWQLKYKVYECGTESAITGTDDTLTEEDIYEDSGLNDYVEYLTSGFVIPSLAINKMITFNIKSITPSQDAATMGMLNLFFEYTGKVFS